VREWQQSIAPGKRIRRRIVATAIVLLGLSTVVAAGEAVAACAGDAVAVGRLCVDKYEASVWSNPPQPGADPGTQYGVTGDDYPCDDNGQNCDQIYAGSLVGARPSGYATWFQAQQACANVGKRLLTNAEWQMAVQGTPDAGPDDGVADCNTGSLTGAFVASGSRTKCKSIYGAYDMVGNLWEWVADWVPRSDFSCTGWGQLSDDSMCFSGVDPTKTGPGALIRGEASGDRQHAGPLAISAVIPPSFGVDNVGFRCAR
jgi:formylglycine-generating enzyme required for sulfatase activity